MTEIGRLSRISDPAAVELWSADVLDDLAARIMQEPPVVARVCAPRVHRWRVVVAVWAVLAVTFGVAAPDAYSLSGLQANRPGPPVTTPGAIADRSA
jgi:hypothetical protein